MFQEIFSSHEIMRLFAILSFRSFRILLLLGKSLIDVGLVFRYVSSELSRAVFPYVGVIPVPLFSFQAYLFPGSCFENFIKILFATSVLVSFWILCSVSLIYFSVFMPVQYCFSVCGLLFFFFSGKVLETGSRSLPNLYFFLRAFSLL